MLNRILRTVLTLTLAFILLFSLSPLARAEETEPSVSDRKGTAPAEGTWLDEQFDADGSAWPNPPTEVETVRIGISFGDSAVETAYFLNSEGAGFRLGIYDEDRNFFERGQTDCDNLMVVYSSNPDYGLMILDWDATIIYYLSGWEESLAIVPLAGETCYGEDSFRGGMECRKLPGHRMAVINCVELETYVKGVVPYEMGGNWPMEALKAQAVCARTYVVYNQNAYAEEGFDITDDTESQVYRGTAWANERTDAAVEETRGQLLRYQGEVCQIYYFAADGGATEDGRYAFDAERPYLLGKRDPFERAMVFPYKSWRVHYTGDQISYNLAYNGYLIGNVVSLEPEYSAMGNVIAMTFVSDSGYRLRLEGRACYTAFGLHSCRFTISRGEGGAFVFRGGGLGHNCGMSQWGARAMDEVYGYNYRQILAFYYTGAYVA